MSYDNDPDALLSALPEKNLRAYDDYGKSVGLRVVACIQAEQLATAGYQLVYVGDDYALRSAVQGLAADPADPEGGAA